MNKHLLLFTKNEIFLDRHLNLLRDMRNYHNKCLASELSNIGLQGPLDTSISLVLLLNLSRKYHWVEECHEQ